MLQLGTVNLAIADHLAIYCYFAKFPDSSHKNVYRQLHKQVSFWSVMKINDGRAHSVLTAIDWSLVLNKTTCYANIATFVNLLLSGWGTLWLHCRAGKCRLKIVYG